jgi:hypothetical protein
MPTLNVPPALIDDQVYHDQIPNIDDDTPVGIPEIAALLGMKRNTIDVWRHYHKARAEGHGGRDVEFIEQEPSTVGGRPWWRWGRVRDWAVEAGHLFLEPDGSADDPVSIPQEELFDH